MCVDTDVLLSELVSESVHCYRALVCFNRQPRGGECSRQALHGASLKLGGLGTTEIYTSVFPRCLGKPVDSERFRTSYFL